MNVIIHIVSKHAVPSFSYLKILCTLGYNVANVALASRIALHGHKQVLLKDTIAIFYQKKKKKKGYHSNSLHIWSSLQIPFKRFFFLANVILYNNVFVMPLQNYALL